ncbi:MAG TPA: 30S ribosomal protein S2, partial [Turneriella sp.]|nr:30S ribosomal protein S2 [Turneriella sp.]
QYPIPANDDAIRAVALFLEIMANAIEEGKEGGEFQQVEIEEESMDEDQLRSSMEKLDDLEEIESRYEERA